jgi:GNAT superfamily N-acetyltransferase
MSDLLVRLYDLPHFGSEARVAAAGITVRRALGPERGVVMAWVDRHFGDPWRSEVAVGFAQSPITVQVAVKHGKMLGFACHDTTAKGFFGPTGVDEAVRGQGIGEALLIATLKAMREAGYGYAVIGDPGPVAFYKKRLDALDIPGSTPGIYAGLLRG